MSVTHHWSLYQFEKTQRSLIQEPFNFQGSFVKIYRNVTAKFRDKKPVKPVSTCSKLEVPENTVR